MNEGCPCGRSCSGCPYEEICGGCLEMRCIHRKSKSRKAESLFGHLHDVPSGSDLHPPNELDLAEPRVLEYLVDEIGSSNVPLQPYQKKWPILIPEVSQITNTTARLGVWPDEGDWNNPFFSPIAWDMTGNLFDKARGAPWVSEPSECGKQNWREILGPEDNWIHDIIFIDRLPDYLALQTPPTAALVVYFNRLQTHYPGLLDDNSSPYPWLMTHGYPSYTDWPPAWHFNLGIRMLSSLLEYIINQEAPFCFVGPGVLYPDRSRRTVQSLPLPYVEMDGEKRLLWSPDAGKRPFTKMDLPRFPGIIPFVPGADVSQLTWFSQMLGKAGFVAASIDALNTIAHENFKGLRQAVRILHSRGLRRVMVYGPWPLSTPQTGRPIQKVSYIPSAVHMDLTNTPPRFWQKSESSDSTKKRWQELPSFKDNSLSRVSEGDWLEICDCRACQNAIVCEASPRSVWRWGHLLEAGFEWAMSVQEAKEDLASEEEENQCLWFNGPSYMTFRRTLEYPPELPCDSVDGVIDYVRVGPDAMDILFPDGVSARPSEIRWGTKVGTHNWAVGFPELEG